MLLNNLAQYCAMLPSIIYRIVRSRYSSRANQDSLIMLLIMVSIFIWLLRSLILSLSDCIQKRCSYDIDRPPG